MEPEAASTSSAADRVPPGEMHDVVSEVHALAQEMDSRDNYFTVIGMAGTGAFGKVWRVQGKAEGDAEPPVYAMKEMRKADTVHRKQVKNTMCERDIMVALSGHPYICQLHYAFQDDTNLYLVMEYLPNGTLFDQITATDDCWPDATVRFYGAEILCGLEYMHQKNIVYRDLKSENVLLDSDGHVRLSDFGLSHILSSKKEKIHSFSGTATYMAPEVLNRGKGHGKSVDVWCYGVLLFIMLAHEPPFWAENTEVLFANIKYEEIDWSIYKDELSAVAISLLQGLLTKDPAKRLGCGRTGLEEIKKHPFFFGVDWNAVRRRELEPLPLLTPRDKPKVHNPLNRDVKPVDPSTVQYSKATFSGFSFTAEGSPPLPPSRSDIQYQLRLQLIQREKEMLLRKRESEKESRISDCLVTVLEQKKKIMEEARLRQEREEIENSAVPLTEVLVANIFSFLSWRDCCMCAAVCSQWRKIVWSKLVDIDLSRPPDLADTAHHDYRSALKMIVQRCPSTRTLKMPSNTSSPLPPIAELSNLEHLSFFNCTVLSDNAIGQMFRQSIQLVPKVAMPSPEQLRRKRGDNSPKRFPNSPVVQARRKAKLQRASVVTVRKQSVGDKEEKRALTMVGGDEVEKEKEREKEREREREREKERKDCERKDEHRDKDKRRRLRSDRDKKDEHRDKDKRRDERDKKRKDKDREKDKLSKSFRRELFQRGHTVGLLFGMDRNDRPSERTKSTPKVERSHDRLELPKISLKKASTAPPEEMQPLVTSRVSLHLLPMLLKVDFTNCGLITRTTLQTIVSVAGAKNLTHVILRGCGNIDDLSVQYLLRLAHLCELDVSHTAVSDDGLMMISSGLRKLEVLRLCGLKGITDEGLTLLPKACLLRSVCVSETAISAEGKEKALEAIQQSQLKIVVRGAGSAIGARHHSSRSLFEECEYCVGKRRWSPATWEDDHDG